MENNSFLTYIKSLIDEGVYNDHCKTEEVNKLTDDELVIISNFIADLQRDKPESCKISETDNKGETNTISINVEIPHLKAEKYKKSFKRHFYDDSQLMKAFELDSKLFNESLDNKENIVIRLVEVSKTFRLVYIHNNNPVLINVDGDGLDSMSSDDYNQFKNDFDKGIGQKLDKNLEFMSNGYKKDNTRKITMFHYGNFDDAVKNENNFTITLIPAIIDDHSDPNYLQFTFVMKLTTVKDGKNVLISETSYYDTFQLCPPNC